jgi:nickel/cobalt transporter (NicO) family protein
VRRLLAAAVGALIATVVAAPSASAHPLGNFSINHLTVVSVSRSAIDVRYVLDQAEIPTFQERGLTGAQVIARKEAEVRLRLTVSGDGRPVPLNFVGRPVLTHPVGQAGLPLTRLVLLLRGTLAGARNDIRIDDGTFPGRVGWKAVVVRPAAGTAVRSSVPSADPTDELRRYPASMLSTPLDQRAARLTVTPGNGTVSAPSSPGAGPAATQEQRAGDGFASVFSQAASGRAALVVLLLLAFGWGAAHALSPGHGKSMVAAYLVGSRGRPRHALALGATVTVAHTAGVFALGFVTLALSAVIVPDRLYPWLNLASGLLVIGVGLAVLRQRVRRARGHAHSHSHHHHHDAEIRTRSLVALGASAGLLPCPSALVVLVVGARGAVVGRLSARASGARLLAVLPIASTFAILFLGTALTLRAIPSLS